MPKFNPYRKPHPPYKPEEKIYKITTVETVEFYDGDGIDFDPKSIDANYLRVESEGDFVSVRFCNKTLIDNPRYQKEMKRYNKLYKTYEKEMEIYNAELEKYNKEQEELAKKSRHKTYLILKKEFGE